MAVTIRDLVVALGVDADTREVKAFDAALSTVKNTMFAVVAAAATCGSNTTFPVRIGKLNCVTSASGDASCNASGSLPGSQPTVDRVTGVKGTSETS